MSLDLKAFLDAELFGKLLADWEHKLTLVTFLTGSIDKSTEPVVYVLLQSEDFAADFIGLLKKDAKLDYFRFPVPVGESALFGCDGVPSVARSRHVGGVIHGRLLVKSTPHLIVEVRGVTQNYVGAILAGQAFYDRIPESLGVSSSDLAKKYGAT